MDIEVGEPLNEGEGLSRDLLYEYPMGLDLRPNSELHAKLLPAIQKRAEQSRATIGKRFAAWDNMANHMTAYIPANDEEKAIKLKDPRIPISVVVPMTYAVRETLLTYMVQAFLGGDFYFTVAGVDPTDTVGAILLQHHMQQQCLHASTELALHTHWSDGFTYGLGIIVPRWMKEYAPSPVTVEEPQFDDMGNVVGVTTSTTMTDQLVWEGNVCDNVEPYNYLPDPRVPAHRVQSGEYVMWLSYENRMGMLEREATQSEGFFNCKYLKWARGRSKLAEGCPGQTNTFEEDKYSEPVDLLHAYIKIIPSEWGLGRGTSPELWLFTIANDRLIVRCGPANLRHNTFPVAVTAPDFDGYSVAPMSRLETLYGLQEFENWLINSHMLNVRKIVSDRLIVDPYQLNIKDLVNNSLIVRTRRSAWGKGVEGAAKQLTVNDVTRGHLADASYVADIMFRVSGATDAVQGVLSNQAPERRTAEEFRNTRASAVSKLEKMAKMISAMSHRRLTYLIASHTIQLVSQASWVRLLGEWPNRLAMEYGMPVQQGRVMVEPNMLDVNFDVVPIDRTQSLAREDPQTMIQLMQVAMANPMVASQVDFTRWFLSIARRFGEKNAADFLLQGNVQAQVVPDEEAGNRAASGELVSV